MAIIVRHVMSNTDRSDLDRRLTLNPVDDPVQVPLEIAWVVGIDCRFVERRPVGNYQQDAARLNPAHQPIMRPEQRLTVHVLLEQIAIEHQAEPWPGAPPWVLS